MCGLDVWSRLPVDIAGVPTGRLLRLRGHHRIIDLDLNLRPLFSPQFPGAFAPMIETAPHRQGFLQTGGLEHIDRVCRQSLACISLLKEGFVHWGGLHRGICSSSCIFYQNLSWSNLGLCGRIYLYFWYGRRRGDTVLFGQLQDHIQRVFR